MGYDLLLVSYGDFDNSEDYIENAKNYALMQMEKMNISQYEDIVFVSKSMGTLIAGWLETKINEKVMHVYLTPLQETLPYITKTENIKIVIAGTDDKYLNASILKAHCEQEGIHLLQIEGVGHRLEAKKDVGFNIDILKQIVEQY